jgi:hypothetical protein
LYLAKMSRVKTATGCLTCSLECTFRWSCLHPAGVVPSLGRACKRQSGVNTLKLFFMFDTDATAKRSPTGWYYLSHECLRGSHRDPWT